MYDLSELRMCDSCGGDVDEDGRPLGVLDPDGEVRLDILILDRPQNPDGEQETGSQTLK